MQDCWKCDHSNDDDSRRCENCNALLRKDDTLIIPILQRKKLIASAKMLKITDSLTDSTPSLILVIENNNTESKVTIAPEAKRYLVGRSDKGSANVDVDLDPFMARELGVSRRHAVFYWKSGNWVVEDVGSTNGTFLNGERLEPRNGYPLQVDDLVQFGRVNCKVYLD